MNSKENPRGIFNNNTTERVNREIKRRTKAIDFPDGESSLILVCERFRHAAATD